MKKKGCLLLACLLVLALALVGCGGDEKLAGTKWKLVKFESQGVTMEGDALASMGDLGMEFVDDTTVKMSLMGMSIEGTYAVEGNTVTIEYFDQPIAFQRNGNQLSAEYDGEAMVLEKRIKKGPCLRALFL